MYMTKKRTRMCEEDIVAVAEAIAKSMNEKIAAIDDDDQYVDYDGDYGHGRYSCDDCVDYAGSTSEYTIGYEYTLTWSCHTWTEYWTDPWCSPQFTDVTNEAGEVDKVEIEDEYGTPVDERDCRRIMDMANRLLA